VLVLGHGFSTFIIPGDDPRTIQVFGEEVAPRCARRSRGNARRPEPKAGLIRSPKALTLRREGIDYDRLPPSLRSQAIEPGDKDYGTVRSTYSRRDRPGW
jgi:hypothetical protein